MTIAVVWQEDGLLWSAADTRLVIGEGNAPITEMAAKIYAIPVATSALLPGSIQRTPHYWTQYGFVYAGSAFPATLTAVTASTLLQNLVRPGERANPPTFEDLAKFVGRLAHRFMADRRQLGGDGLFQAAFFGWCPYALRFKVAQIDGRDDASGFRVEVFFPEPPSTDGNPWVVLGSAADAFHQVLNRTKGTEFHITKGLPRRAIDAMVAANIDASVGGSTSLGYADQWRFQLVAVEEPIERGKPQARLVFNGLDLHHDIGFIGQYLVGISASA